jgi:protein TonB
MLIAVLAMALATGDSTSPPKIEALWAAAPTGEDYIETYPERAWRRHMSGRVMLSCMIDNAGRFSRCQVVSETPEDLGFGAAALRLAPKFRLAPARSDQSIAGRHFQFAIDFQMPATD